MLIYSSLTFIRISSSRLFVGGILSWSDFSGNNVVWPKSLSRLPIWAFPRAQMGFPARWKSLFRVSEKAFRCFLFGKTLVFRLLSHASKSRVYEGGRLPSVYARFSATLHRMNIHSVIIILHEYAFFSYGFSSFVPRSGWPFFPFHSAWLVVRLALSRSASVSLLTLCHRLPFVLHVFLFRIPSLFLLHGCLFTVSSSVCAL